MEEEVAMTGMMEKEGVVVVMEWESSTNMVDALVAQVVMAMETVPRPYR